MEKPSERTVKLDRKCEFCQEPAEYDFKTKFGPWAYGCSKHFIQLRVSEKTIMFTKLERTNEAIR